MLHEPDAAGAGKYIARWYRRSVIEQPLPVLLLLGAVALFFLYFTSYFRLDASADSLLLENDQDLKAYREIARRYETQDFLLLTFTPTGDLLAEQNLTTLGRLRDSISALTGVASVLSILDVPLVGLSNGSLSDIARNAKTLGDTGVDPDRAREELVSSPIFSELVISKDGQTTALVINLPADRKYQELIHERERLLEQRRDAEWSGEQQRRLEQVNTDYENRKRRIDARNHETIKAIRALMRDYSAAGELHLGGISMIADDMIRFVKNDLIRFGAGVFIFLVLMLWLIFRRFQWILLPLACCTYSGLVMVGLLGLVDWPVTVISSNFISLMLILTMSMNIHLIVRYRELSRDNPALAQPELVMRTAGRMVRPCLYTALTTMIGFSSLVVSQIKPVIHFGLMMSIGLLVTFLTTFILFPGLLMLFPKQAVKAGETANRVTPWLGRLTQRYGRTVLLVCAGIGLGSVFGMTQLRVENSFIDYFSEDTEIYRGQRVIDEKLGGTTPLDVILDFDLEGGSTAAEHEDSGFEELDALFAGIESDPADSWFTAQRLDRISVVHDYLDSLDAVGKVLSLNSFLEVMREVNNGQPTDAFEMALVYKRMPEDMRASLIDPYISIAADQARINVRIIDSMPDLRRQELLQRIHQDLDEKLGLPPSEYRLTGMLVLYNNMLQSLFRSQILTLGAVMLGIALMLWLLFRSVRLAVIGILPNLLAAVAVLGLMGLAGIPLDMMTITIAAITIGIAVDDCIHYIYRFREEFTRHGQYRKTMHYCHANIGAAMFYTSITIIIGFSILILSNFIPTIIFGLLTTLAMLVALLAALTLLPELILVIRPFGEEHKEQTQQAAHQ